MATKWQRFSVSIPKTIKPNERIALSEDIIKYIYNRSKKGRDVEGKAFPQYTNEYAKYKGTSRGKVDLILEDKMLKSMKLISHKSGKLLIGYDNGSKENAKADGNNRGTYGNPAPLPGKARKFVGISKKDLNMLLDKYKKIPSEEIKRIAKETVEGIS